MGNTRSLPRATRLLSLCGALVGLLIAWSGCGDNPPAAPTPPPPRPPYRPPTDPLIVGQWESRQPSPIVQVHLHLLVNGTVLSWGRYGDSQIWDPATGTFTSVALPAWLFCAGHDFLPDGRLLVAGGHIV